MMFQSVYTNFHSPTKLGECLFFSCPKERSSKTEECNMVKSYINNNEIEVKH